jgi:hypothetical protein
MIEVIVIVNALFHGIVEWCGFLGTVMITAIHQF